jgi:DNA-binding beta-propeller fold protein YncE
MRHHEWHWLCLRQKILRLTLGTICRRSYCNSAKQSFVQKKREDYMPRIKFAACVVGAIAPWLFATAGISAADDEVFTKTDTIPVETFSFDIGFVDPIAGVYVLADRTNKAIDVIDTGTNELVDQLEPGFVGAVCKNAPPCPKGPFNNDLSGPNGVLIVHQTEVWVGDGNSRVWVLHLHNGKPIDMISTALPDTKDTTRADELCHDPNDDIILVANDASSPPFVTFISSKPNHMILGRILMDGKSGSLFHHGPEATAGIEQCQWSPRTGKFYLNLPATTSAPDGTVLVIDPVTEEILQTWDVHHSMDVPCTAPQGMAIGPTNQILLGCNGPEGSLIINEDPANAQLTVTHPLAGLGGNDEVWFNPGDDQYFLADSVQGKLNVADPDGTTDKPAPTLIGSHSVAADPVRNQVYVPFNDGSGIGVFTVTEGTDDPSICVGQGAPVISMGDEGTGSPVLLRVVCPPKGNK